MTALTIELDDRLIDAVRETATRRHMTVDALIGEQIEPLASAINRDEEKLAAARAELVDLMETSSGRLGPNYKWNRAELYEHRMRPRHQHPDLRGPRSDG